jgi:hypothetical protein
MLRVAPTGLNRRPLTVPPPSDLGPEAPERLYRQSRHGWTAGWAWSPREPGGAIFSCRKAPACW